jgi:HD-like signal output (HDOD) protein/GGDEF domain-containing protein
LAIAGKLAPCLYEIALGMNTPALNPSLAPAITVPAAEAKPSDIGTVMDCLVRRAAHLYTLPAVAVKVLELTNHPQVDSLALKECIENDPALSAKVLRVVNSSLFGLRCQVSNLGQALALLGTKPLKLLVLGFSLPTGLFADVGAGTLGWYWRRTLTKAVAAREICETVWQVPGDEAFVAALVQDLGMLLLIQELGASYIDFLEKARQRGYDVLALEAASLGFDHTTLTASLLGQWGLPKAIVDAVAWRPEQQNGDPVAPSHDNVGNIVYLAEWITRLLADGRSEALGNVLAIGRRDHALAPGQLNALVETLEQKVRGLADVFSLDLPQATDYRELLALAHTRLADVAADAAGDMLRGESAASSLAREMRSLGTAAFRFAERSTPSRSGPAAVDRCRSHTTTKGEASIAEPVQRCHAPSGPAQPSATPLGPAASRFSDHPANHHRALLDHLAVVALGCRQSRCPLSLLLVELGRADELVLTHGIEGLRQFRSALERACRGLDCDQLTCLPHCKVGFAVILRGCDRQLAVRLGNRLIEEVGRNATLTDSEKHPLPTVCVGAATVSMPPKNFPAEDLIQAANRCLYGSHSSGGGVVRSIEIY